MISILCDLDINSRARKKDKRNGGEILQTASLNLMQRTE